MDDALNDLLHAPLAGVGHNNPPDPIQEIHERLTLAYIDLADRRDKLVEGVARVPEKIDDEIAPRVIDFVKQIKAATSKAKDAFKTEKGPYLEGGRAVDAFFKKITDPLEQAAKVLNKRLTDFQIEKEAEERRRREAAEAEARAAAEKARREAEEAARKLAEESQLGDAIAKEEAARAASAAAIQARKEAEAKAADLSRTRGDYGGVSSLRAEWKGEMVDRDTLDLEALRPHLPSDAIDQAIRAFVKSGGRELRGARIWEHKYAVTR